MNVYWRYRPLQTQLLVPSLLSLNLQIRDHPWGSCWCHQLQAFNKLSLKYCRYVGNIPIWRHSLTPKPLFDVAKVMFSEKLKCECYLVTIFHILTWYQKYQDLHNIVTAHRYVLDSPVSSLKIICFSTKWQILTASKNDTIEWFFFCAWLLASEPRPFTEQMATD